ncbi:MAG: molybdate ABC transporter substrate-binding protein, partial [Solirubrobacterales bacterium]
MTRINPLGILTAGLATALAGCGGDAAQTAGLTVVAATSLKQPFSRIARDFERTNPGTSVRLSFVASDRIASQLRAGLRADVVATADDRQMRDLRAAGAVDAATAFAGNRMTIAVAKNSELKLGSPRDLAQNVRLAVGDQRVPVGAYARESIERLGDRYGGSFESRVRGNIVTFGHSAADVIAPVALGGVDASISYATDLRGTGGRVRAVELPGWAQPVIAYWIAPA